MSAPLQPHQDPTAHNDPSVVTILEHVTFLISTVDRRFDTQHNDLKAHVAQRFDDSYLRQIQRFESQTAALNAGLEAQEKAVSTALAASSALTERELEGAERRHAETDLRYQQRFDAQTKALEAALAAQKEAVQTALVAAEKATSKAEVASDKRFDSVNEFRKTLTDQSGTFLPRAEAEARMNGLTEKIEDIKGVCARLPSVEAQVAEMYTEVKALREFRAQSAGKSDGMNASWGYLVGGISLIVVIVNVIIALIFK